MYAKLALRNIKRSFSDYAIYFLTLSFVVALFYVFNALPESGGLSTTSASLKLIMQNTIRGLSVIIAVALGFLIIYANNFLIKKRKKEIGTYLIMGMDQKKLGGMLFAETLILGALALVIGLIFGIFLSQGFSYLVAKMFDQSFDLIHFSISWKTMLETGLYFLAAFFVVALLSSQRISRIKIIDLLQGAKKGERTGFYKPVVAAVSFVLSLACLGTAYWLGLGDNNVLASSLFGVVFLLGTVGTYLFYFSSANFLLLFLKNGKWLYYRGINLFSFRQLTSKINTHTVMMGTISMMLFVTICTFAGGFGINAFIRNELQNITPNDFELWALGPIDQENLTDYLVEAGYDGFDITCVQGITSDVTLADTITDEGLSVLSDNGYLSYFQDEKIMAFSLSELNRLLAGQGKTPFAMGEDEFALYSIQNNANLSVYQASYIEQGGVLKTGGTTLKAAQDGFLDTALMGTYTFAGIGAALILPDDIAAKMETVGTLAVIDFPQEIIDTDFNAGMLTALRSYPGTDEMSFGTGSQVGEIESLYGSSALAVFVGLYLGLMFLVISSALLALHQLTDAAEHKPRYVILGNLGADPKMLDGSIFKQILLYFFAPLFLTVINGAMALKVIADLLLNASNFNIWPVIGISVLIFVIFYSIYFIASYLGYKRILKTS